MGRGRTLATLAVGAIGSRVAWGSVHRRDVAALDADPHRDVLTAVPPGIPTSLTTSDGTTLHVRVHTPAAPRAAVVFAHGWGMGVRFWVHQLRALMADHQVIAYDQRGHGGSGHVGSDGYSIDALGGDVADVVERFARADLPVVVVGHSLGGMSVLATARNGRLLDRADGAVLIDTGADRLTAGVFRGLGVLEEVLGDLGGRALRVRMPVPQRTTPISSRLVKFVSLSPTASPSSVALTEQLFLDAPVDTRADLGTTLGDLDLSESLPLWKVPTTVVVGAQDRLTPVHHSERLVRELPDAELVVIDRAGHQSPLERPVEVTAAIEDRIARVLDVE